ncbi:MAG: UDP-glucose 4-epimerase GalE [Firmicutes bacterium]|nr:UDP-glucose 4-epimerase GalE [Bacillota bacterium]
MKILITGASGFIGSHTAVELLNSGFNVFGLDNFCNSSRKVVNNIKKITNRNFFIYDCDIRNKEFLCYILDKERPNFVIHFAGLKSVEESILDPIKYYENNVYGTINLLSTMKMFKIKNLIFSSSATVYGNTKPPFDELASVNIPISPYGKSKFIVEQILFDLFDFNTVILRYFNPVGAHDSLLIGENPSDIPNNLMPLITQVAYCSLPKLKIFGDNYDTPDGTCIRDYIHVTDLAKGHVKSIDYLVANKGTHVFNLGTGKGTSVMELIKTFEKVNSVKINFEIVDRRPGDVDVSYASIEKASEKLKWKTKFDLDEMCRSAWEWEKNKRGIS